MDDAAWQKIREQYGLDEPSTPQQAEHWAWLDMMNGIAVWEGGRDGRRAEARGALRRVLARRSLALTPEQDAAIEACTCIDTLERWVEQAVTSASAEEALA
jgi:hypothetical protein